MARHQTTPAHRHGGMYTVPESNAERRARLVREGKRPAPQQPPQQR